MDVDRTEDGDGSIRNITPPVEVPPKISFQYKTSETIPPKISCQSKASKSSRQSEDGDFVDNVLGLLCFRIYDTFRVIFCIPAPSRLGKNLSTVNTSWASSKQSNQQPTDQKNSLSVRVINGGDCQPSNSTIKEKSSIKIIPKEPESQVTNVEINVIKKPSSKELNPVKKWSRKIPFISKIKSKNDKPVSVEPSVVNKDIFVRCHKTLGRFLSKSSVTVIGDGISLKGRNKRPVNFYKEMFEDTLQIT